MSNVLVVDNLPVVPEAKFQKLLDFVTKIYSALGKIVDNGITMPLSPTTGETEGFAFIEFASKEDADKAAASTQGWDFDKAHKLTVMTYTEFASYVAEPETFVPPSLPPSTAKSDLYYWMQDESARDEFLLRWAAPGPNGDMHQTEVLWAETKGPPALDYGGERQRAAGRVWTERAAVWSPRGTYLVTFHPQGVVLWGGRGFQEIRRIAHPRVNAVLFSPDEAFIGTWSGYEGNPSPDRAMLVWDARTGSELRAFRQLRQDDDFHGFDWSADSKLLARVGVDPTTGSELVTVYEAPTLALLESKSIKAPGARGLAWAPPKSSANLLAWWSPEKVNTPTCVTLMKLPSRELLRARNLFNVDGCELQWHPDGSFLCVLASKALKKKKTKLGIATAAEKKGSAGYSLELFRLKDKGVPVEVVETSVRVVDFAWEPNGVRFAMVLGDGPTRYTVAVYSMVGGALGADGGKSVQLLFNLEEKACNSLAWSPRGENLLLLGSANLGGLLEFYNVEQRRSFGSAEHPQASGAVWDPSGRLVATLKAQPLPRPGMDVAIRETVENGYSLWTFQGARVFEASKPKLFGLAWRPRPECVGVWGVPPRCVFAPPHSHTLTPHPTTPLSQAAVGGGDPRRDQEPEAVHFAVHGGGPPRGRAEKDAGEAAPAAQAGGVPVVPGRPPRGLAQPPERAPRAGLRGHQRSGDGD